MKRLTRSMTLLMALCLILALFAGCGGNQGTAGTPTPAGSETPGTTTTPGTETPAATPDPDSPYHFAPGNYEVGEDGIATEKYEYTLPISTTDEVLTYWTTCYTPNYIDEASYAESPFPVEVERQTGVNIEYQIISLENRAQNYAVLLAADDLPDMVTNANAYHVGVFEDAITLDNYYVNLYDYKEYAPNYFYEVAKNPEDEQMQNSVYLSDDVVGLFYCLRDQVYPQNALFVRSDWLDIIGWEASDIVTWDDTHELLTLFKSQIPTATYPLLVFNCLEAAGNHWNMFDTLAYVSPYGLSMQVDENGQVFACNTTFRDYNLMSSFNAWYNEGLIDPNWGSYSNMTSEGCNANYYNDMYGYISLATGDIATEGAVLDAPDAEWIPLHDPVLEEGQVLHLGGYSTRVYYGAVAVSTNCENIELAISWLDWRYSDPGADLMSWGVEGVAWEYNEEGERQVTEYVTSSPGKNMTMFLLIQCMNTLTDAGLDINSAHYSFPGGEQVIEAYDYLRERNYDGAFEWPSGCSLSNEELNEVMEYQTDVLTYISENYLAFLDGSKPLSEWADYEAGLQSIGLQEILDVYQNALDTYNAQNA